VRAYPVPDKRPRWRTQVEFLDGTIIDGMSDTDCVERWRRVASWTDTSAEQDPAAWQELMLNRARAVYGAELADLDGLSAPESVLEALADAGCLMLRRNI